MTALVLGVVALAAMGLSYAFVVMVLVLVRQPEARRDAPSAPAQGTIDDGRPAETMSRVLGEIERLAALREQGALTDKEFAAAKAKFLRREQGGPRARVEQRAL
ncbi:MAG TPA: SHOCT domain-containing protein [Acidimicrobiia bacterium]|nr:SHOCT domain-containing protein [Acidimicrobiia bacterium]